MKRRSREISVPDITPLIDVVFLLLIFFMVSTVFKKDELALLLDLPKASSGQSVGGKVLNILIEVNENDMAYNGKKLLFEEIEKNISLLTKKDTPVELRIDKSVRYEKIVKIIDLLKKYQLSNLTLITES